MTNRDEVVVIGGGAVGVSCAYYLAKAGRQVRLIERNGLCAGSSYGNAGLVPPSRSLPMSVPGAIGKALKSMLDRDGPFRMKLRPDPDLVSWLWRFKGACTEAELQHSTKLLRDLIRASRQLYEELNGIEGFDFGYHRNGLLTLFRTEQGHEYALHEADLLRTFGIESDVLDARQVAALEPTVTPVVLGGVHCREDAHIDPPRFVEGLADLARRLGVHIQTNTDVLALRPNGRTIVVETTRGELVPDQVILANGAWAAGSARKLGVRLPIQPAKGYSITLPREREAASSIPLLLTEARTTLTPMGDVFRATSKLELVGLDQSVDKRRIARVPKALREYIAFGEAAEPMEQWAGMRPLTPDGLPLIGRHPDVARVVFAVGHGRLGIALAPLTGQLVAELAAGDAPSVSLASLSPDRFSPSRRFLVTAEA